MKSNIVVPKETERVMLFYFERAGAIIDVQMPAAW